MQRLIMSIVVLSVALGFPVKRSRAADDSSKSQRTERSIRLEIVVNAPVEKVWQAWTTRAGIQSFFAPDCNIDLRVLGKYEILFAPQAPAGLRGAEDNLILAIQERKMFAFTWDAPPDFPVIRKQRTSVVLRFTRIDQNKTKVDLTHSGWGEGDEWNKVYNYFIVAWGDIVLPFLKHSLESGPIDWKNPPQKLEKATRIAD